ncbi:hypothetical protein [Lichenibacterium dinghuense]|uniref:hypothetical protein n=1 Tax=Lichenibacterium dinghuense TaxID=2895977 RepID=UPI001F3A3003|nr:hypothetical protein [Lichenibacterium sp. 6Y81]
MTSPKAPADARAKAESKFHLAERRKSEADQALGEARAARTAEAQKTARLKALRLAKEEADRAAAAAAPKAAPAKAPPKRKARVAATA